MGNGLVITGLSLAPGSITDAMFTGDAATKLAKGLVVQRTTGALPASTTSAIFNVVGGRCIILAVVGYITTIIQAQACTLKMQANPTAAGTSVDMCATLDVNAAAAFTYLSITGTAANAMLNAVAGPLQATSWLLSAGTIDLVASATNTGSVQWSCVYVPLDAGATVTAA